MRVASRWSSSVLALALGTACGDDDGVVGSGSGGDEMPDDEDLGPGGPGCVPHVGRPLSNGPGDVTAHAQAATISGVVGFRDDVTPSEEPIAGQAIASTFPLVAGRRPVGATTQSPHVHERWGESRKLELSYCVTGFIGDDAEVEYQHHMVVRSLADTMAEWERVTGANFVHIADDDTPTTLPQPYPGPDDTTIIRPECAAGTQAYFGVFTYPSGIVQAETNPVPQAWADPGLEPLGGGVLARSMMINSGMLDTTDDAFLRSVLRHELGHVMGFEHEEINASVHHEGCDSDVAPRPLTSVDRHSIMTTPACAGVYSDAAEILTHYDRLSAFFLHHTPRSRFETRPAAIGYRYGGAFAGGAEILWHSEGSTQGTLWRPQVVAGEISFVEESFPYSSPKTTPAGGWYPNESEVVIPLKLDAPNSFGLLFYGPGPDVGELVVFNSAGSTTAIEWSHDAFAVPVVGRFDGSDLGRDVVYLYQPGTEDSTALLAEGETVAIVTDVPQQPGYAYPLAAPYRGSAYPDDIVWLEPHTGKVTTWRLGGGMLEVVEIGKRGQGELGLVPGESIPAVGDFNGDGRADIMWQGVSNQAAGFREIEDVLWLSQSAANELVFATVSKSVGRTFRPFVGDFDGDGIDDIFWHRSWSMTKDGPSVSTTDPSYIWYFDDTGGHEAEAFVLDGDWSPYVGDFDADGCHDIAWFDAVGDALHVWRCMPNTRDFDCGATASTPPNAAPTGMHWGF